MTYMLYMTYTIKQTQDALKTFFETNQVIYQANVGYFVQTSKQVISMDKLNEFLDELNLKIGTFGLNVMTGNLGFLIRKI